MDRALRCFVARTPAGGWRVVDGEAEHLTRVLRARAGDIVLGLDGEGGEHPLRIRTLDRRVCELEAAGAARIEPAPGEADAPLPWIEVAVAWPRPNRADDMLDRLTQLGVAAIRPLACAHAGPQGLPDDEHKRERALRVLREACKQSRRTWLPELHTSSTIHALASGVKPGALACLDPDAGAAMADWIVEASAAATATRARPLVLCIGPEGGFDDRERAQLAAAGAAQVALSPHILRIETAAEAALALAVGLLRRRA
jgi:16S rRNA (uracil1498-N3)-methyltransferase